MTITRSNSQRTCEAVAVLEVHVPHALGKQELVDGTCRWEGDETEKEKVRNEEARAAEPQPQKSKSKILFRENDLHSSAD